MEELAIKVDSLSKVYGITPAVKNLTFGVKAGEIHGFLGPNGAGKSTTMKLIAGLLRPSGGAAWVMGHRVDEHPELVKENIGILLENPPLYRDMLVRDYLIFVTKLHKVPQTLIMSRVDEAIQKLQLEDVANRLIGNLSKGFKQRVGVAQAIVHNPKIVILDEPTVGLDPEAVIKMRELIKSLAKDHTVMLSSHQLHEISLICDKVTIISKGSLQASGPISEIQKSLSRKRVIHIEVTAMDESLIQKIKAQPYVMDVSMSGNRFSVYTDNINDHRSDLAALIVKNKNGLLLLKQEDLSLEEIFISITGGQA